MSARTEYATGETPHVSEDAGIDDGAIAIIGMSGSFPGAPDVDRLWDLVSAGDSGLTHFSDDELRAEGVSEHLLTDPNYVKVGGVLDNVTDFDAGFFGVSAGEGQILDPQQRLLLEHSWHALEDAGREPRSSEDSIGVFCGAAWSSYLQNNLAPSDVASTMGPMAVGLANDKDSAATRIAHSLGLTGPAYAVQSYCSTSLVAVCAAASSLANYECDAAIAGGAAVGVPHRVGYLYQDGGIAPPDGECRAFDADGRGAVLGNGVAVVALARLEDAIANGDHVYAVIRGWAVNNDGDQKVGFTAPGVRGQAAVIAEALSSADLGPDDVDYIEAHGTGTALGDAAEISALQQVFGSSDCLIGSIKTNVGHLDRAAGVTGLIKASLSLKHEVIPATRNYETPNAQFAKSEGSLSVVTEQRPWPREGGRVRRAGVSAFGIGGTNAHVVLEEPPQTVPSAETPDRPEVLVWSARSAQAADNLTDALADRLGGNDAALADVAHTLQIGRRAFEQRRATLAGTRKAAADRLASPGAVLSGVGVAGQREVAFLIAGTGEQYPGMAAELYGAEPVFAAAIDHCRGFLTERLGFDPLTEMLAPRSGVDVGAGLRALRESTAADATPTDRLQPATFAVGYALARLLQSWGVQPTVLAGYSVGEYVAACLGGVLSIDDALAVVAYRAQLIHTLPGGSMLAVGVGEHTLRPYAERLGLDIAAVNSAELAVASGPAESVEALRSELGSARIVSRPLATTHAFHSRMLAPIRDDLEQWIRGNIELRSPTVPIVSNVSGERLTTEQATDPSYWVDHMCATVRFDAVLGEVVRTGDHAIVEIGPGRSLGAMATAHPDLSRERWPHVVSTLPAASDGRSAPEVLADGVARLWLCGVDVDWKAHRADRGGRTVSLPGYPFQRSRYWIEPPASGPAPEVRVPAGSPADAPPEVSMLVPCWELSEISPAAERGSVALIGGPQAVVQAVSDELRSHGTVVSPVAEIGADAEPATLIDLRGMEIEPDSDAVSGVMALAPTMDEWLGRRDGVKTVMVVTAGAHTVREGESPVPGQAGLPVVVRVAGQEYPHAQVRSLDLDPVGTPAAAAAAIAQELNGNVADQDVVAYRDRTRYCRRFAEVEPPDDGPRIQPGGTYLITGGLGRVGQELAEHFARRGAANLVLTTRRQVDEHPVVDRLADLGARANIVTADVTDSDGMRTVIDAVVADAGRLDGVVHAAAESRSDTFAMLRDLDEHGASVHFGAKVQGAQVLSDLLDELEPDQAPAFRIAFSSTSSVLGGLAFASYGAANAALTAVCASGDEPRWTSVAWDTWETSLEELEGSAIGASMRAHTLSRTDALAAFDAVVRGGSGAYVIAAGGLDHRLDPAPAAGTSTAAPQERHPRPDLPQPYVEPVSRVERDLSEVWADVLGVEPVGTRDNFFDLGGNSLLALQMLTLVTSRFGATIAAVELFEAPTVAALATRIGNGTGGELTSPASRAPVRGDTRTVRVRSDVQDDDSRIAVVGMAGRFPGASDVNTFWKNVCDGVESIRFFSRDELIAAGVDPEVADDPSYVPARPVLDDVGDFDAGFFGMSPRMAALTDPQQRLFLESCWEALEHAGYAADVPDRGRVGVYGGANLSTYLLQMAPESIRDVSTYEVIMGNEKDALTTTVSYLFNLQGPSVAVQTFCSTSLVATHLAVQGLRNNECEVALAGGVSVRVPSHVGHHFSPGGQESPDGHVRTFDAKARGSIFGDGVAVVVLKRLSDAIRDGDHVWSVIRGTAMNNDGALKVGYTAPSVVGQAEVVSAALDDAGIRGQDVDYIEAHGTATELGDPIEVAALTRAFGEVETPQQCLIGSVKSNIGHLDRAAGATGLIKTSLALQDKLIPPTLHYTEPNPEIDFRRSPFRVATEATPWPMREDKPAIAGINSLGMGGTNVHVVVERAPQRTPSKNVDDDSRRFHVLPLSARTEPALEQSTADLARALRAQPDTRLADVAYTLQMGRKRFEHRAFVVASSTIDAANAVANHPGGTVETAIDRPVALWLAGFASGVARHAMLRELTRREPDLRAEIHDSLTGLDLADEVEQWLSGGEGGADPSTPLLGQFVAEIAIARLLGRWGVVPSSIVAYGVGEYVAACLNGALSTRDAVAAIRHWGSLHALSTDARADAFVTWTRENLRVSVPHQAWVSAVRGAPIDPDEVIDPAYWVGVLESKESVDNGVTWLRDEPGIAVVEIGSDLLSDAAADMPTVAAVSADARGVPDDEVLATALAELWLYGVDIDFAALHGRGRDDVIDEPSDLPGRIPLPTYPFQRQTYWIESNPQGLLGAGGHETSALQDPEEEQVTLDSIASLERLPEEDWFFQETWRQQSAPAGAAADGGWLFYTGEGTPSAIVESFRKRNPGATVHCVRQGAEFGRDGEDFAVRPGSLDDAISMVRELRANGESIGHVVHLWTSDAGPDERIASDGLHTLVALIRAMAEVGWTAWDLDVVVSGTQEVIPGDVTNPMAATLTGPCRVVSLEHPRVRARLLDIDESPMRWTTDAVAHELGTEMCAQAPVVALRHGRRWVPEYAPMTPEPTETVPWRTGGVYLITGGLGGIGLAMAERLVREYAAKVVLLGRRGAPSKATWPASLDGAAEVVIGDVSDTADVQRAIDHAFASFGALHGVIHAAGVPGEGLIQLKAPAEVDEVLRPKVGGTLALAEALGIGKPDEIDLDFLVLFSSITSTTGGGPGQVDYCAANAYLDAFAAAYDTPERRVVAIGWGEWAWNAWEEGLAGYDQELQDFFRDNRARIGIDFDAGWRAMGTALSSGQPRVVVCSQDFPMIVRHSSKFTVETVAGVTGDSTELHPRPDLVSTYQEPSGDAETSVAEIWRRSLRLEAVGVHDNFFELGGNSLLGVTIVGALQDHFDAPDLPPHVLYEAPTIASLVQRLRTDGECDDQGPPASEQNNVRAQLRRSGVQVAADRRRTR